MKVHLIRGIEIEGNKCPVGNRLNPPSSRPSPPGEGEYSADSQKDGDANCCMVPGSGKIWTLNVAAQTTGRGNECPGEQRSRLARYGHRYVPPLQGGQATGWTLPGPSARAVTLRASGPKSLSENSKGSCFRGKAGLARRDERAYPLWVCKRGATPPDRPYCENPPGGRSFARGLRWLGPLASQASASQRPGVDVRSAQAVSPLRGCAGLAALVTAKIHCRRPTFNYQTGSEGYFYHG